jgi:hypothetical protein
MRPLMIVSAVAMSTALPVLAKAQSIDVSGASVPSSWALASMTATVSQTTPANNSLRFNYPMTANTTRAAPGQVADKKDSKG